MERGGSCLHNWYVHVCIYHSAEAPLFLRSVLVFCPVLFGSYAAAADVDSHALLLALISNSGK